MIPPYNDQSKLAIQIREKLKQSSIMQRIIDSQKDIIQQNINSIDESAGISSRAKQQQQSNPNSNDNSVIVQVSPETNSSFTNSTTKSRLSNRHRFVKRVRSFLKGWYDLKKFSKYIHYYYIFDPLFEKHK
jgi:hypothetical protein